MDSFRRCKTEFLPLDVDPVLDLLTQLFEELTVERVLSRDVRSADDLGVSLLVKSLREAP